MKKKIDYTLLIIILSIVIYGLLMVYSASNITARFKYNDSFYYIKRQILFACIGIVLMFLVSKVDLEKIKSKTTIIFFICLGLLILVLIPGIGSVRGGARSWIGFGSFSIQPAEFMKFALILLFSKYFEKYYQDLKKFKNFFISLILIVLIFGLIMLQPDFGTGLVILLSSIIMLFIVGVPFKYFLGLIVIGLIGLGGLVISAPYRLERILAFIDPWSDPLGSGFQGIQSILAVAPSGLFGLGYNKSIQKHFFLPEPQNDFIFAIICEEMGLIGALVLVLLYICLLRKAIKISIKTNNLYYSFLALNIGISIFIQAVINICVVVGLLPITGITLPLVSYGGSSLVITLVGLGILLNISRHKGDI